MTEEEARKALVKLIESGWVNGIDIFGEDDCCEHGLNGSNPGCPSSGFGLMDRDVQRRHRPGLPYGWAGSDCNRAGAFMMRPHDKLMTPEIKALLADD